MRFLTCILVGVLSVSVFAEEITILWPSEVLPSDSPPNVPEAALGIPDQRCAAFVPLNATATYADFNISASYDKSNLESLLNVDSEAFAQADFIAFESNGTPHLGFEKSIWTFASGDVTETITVISQALAFGEIMPRVYETFFNIQSHQTRGDVPFVLFDLQVVDPLASDFTVTVKQGGRFQLQTPEIDAMGVIQPTLSERLEMLILEKTKEVEIIKVFLEEESSILEQLNNMLEQDNYGGFKKADLIKVKANIHSSMQHQEQAKNALTKSIKKLESALAIIEPSINNGSLGFKG
ncbi:MAG TPA: hypothetical protein ENH94_01690 [Phycisphaerales bacterium]|nr:hypothetical protein [Phycisphaerales bacterium]